MRREEDRARIDWLRDAAKEGFGAFARGDSVTLNSPGDLDAFFDQVHKDAAAELAVE